MNPMRRAIEMPAATTLTAGSRALTSVLSTRLTRPSLSTVGVKEHVKLPAAARAYLARIEALCGVPIDLISTGPDREETIVLHHPFRPA